MTDSPIVSGMFHAVPLPHQSGLRPASFPRGEALVPGFRALGIFGNGSVLSRSGTAHRPFPTYFNGRIQMNNVGRSNNCQLSIAHCQLESNCPLSTVPHSLKPREKHERNPLLLGKLMLEYDRWLWPEINSYCPRLGCGRKPNGCFHRPHT